jgi:hypothetical protein
MIPQAKISAVKEYLRGEFPGSEVDDADDFEHASRKFRVVGRKKIHIVKFERVLLEDNSDIEEILRTLELGTFIQINGERQVLVTHKGLMLL